MDIESALKSAVSGSGRDLSDPVVIAFMKAGIVSIDFVWRVAGQADGEAETAVGLWLKRGVDATRAGASPSAVEALIEGGLNVNAVLTTSRRSRDGDGMSSTLLIMAASRNAAIASFLLRHGASVAVRNRRGETALKTAVMYNQPDIVRLFILAGAASGEDGAASLRRAEWPLRQARRRRPP
ncbi:hypothetical protein EMIHUDRAFT_213528 [Emiliania huxleyi CCMP1516]|uniref:Ankyrin repeat domain-containing protein n=2 Tax=Emiliania huxleyi TaxID=2903 RepID=A0A0D3IM45_EMIH1|nr:hypothetical protein EMIHUDRAFT_213528 [Emiliania huxleyi CCMP1516]EOD12330.1 hypothetical protein EMIHUDRAFT_213528 [Emiliania huxleyi CCMP1516]|eukprot:XP_005764759.1 hypothetical protein EMIHUDRAFT_213528 [Emiliania huxleyi CCMP1516]